jgi:hypothetical protein
MAGFLLLPEDEPALIEHLLEAESLKRLAHDDLTFGPPVVGVPARPVELGEPARMVFWVPQLGELGAGRLDLERAPVLCWNRSRWHASGALCPGRLTAQARARKDQPRALLQVHERVERWMKRSGAKVDRRLWAFPHAARWVAEGGPVRPTESARA